MKLLKYLIGLMAVTTLYSCDIPEYEKKEYPVLTNIVDTMWYSVDVKNQIYYDIYFYGESGMMVSFNSSERTEEIKRKAFTYTFTPATDKYDALVDVTFSNGKSYGGILIPKGHLQINNEDVYLIQLYGLNDKGEVIYNEKGEVAESILMWKE